MKETIGIIGGGSFGSALADIIGSKGHPVLQWYRAPESAERFNAGHENAKYLPGSGIVAFDPIDYSTAFVPNTHVRGGGTNTLNNSITIRTLTEERNMSAAILGSMVEGVAVVNGSERLVFANLFALSSARPARAGSARR